LGDSCVAIPKMPHKIKLTANVREIVLAMGKQHKPQYEIAARVGVSSTCVSKALIAAGIRYHVGWPTRGSSKGPYILSEQERTAEDGRLLSRALEGRCSTRACVFPSLIDGKCRRCYEDSKATFSLHPSTMPLMFECAPAESPHW